MAEPGVVSFGVKIGYSADSSGGSPYTQIPRVFSITKPGRALETIDATHHGSSGREFLASPIEDFGEVAVSFNYMPADETWIDSIVGDLREYQIEFPDGSTITFDGIAVTHTPSDSTIDSKEESTLTIRVTGKPSYAAGA